jgi:hypothetical protein
MSELTAKTPEEVSEPGQPLYLPSYVHLLCPINMLPNVAVCLKYNIGMICGVSFAGPTTDKLGRRGGMVRFAKFSVFGSSANDSN